LSSLIVFPLYRIARHLGATGRQAWIASAAASLHPYLVLNASRLLTESLFATLIAAAFAGLFSGRGKHPARAAVLAGVWLGLATLCRPTPIPLLPALPLIWLFFPGGSRRWFGAVAAAVAVLTLAPWVLSLHARHGVWIPVTTAGSYNLWNANNAYMTPGVMATPIPDVLKQQLLPLPEKDRIVFLRREAQRWIQENRRAFWRSRRLQFARFWKVFPEDFWNRRVSFQEGYETVRSPNQFLISAGKVFWFACLNILLLASIVESIRQLRRRTPEILAVAACLAAATLVHTVMTGYARYRYPLDPLWMIIGITGTLHAVSLFLGPGKTPAVERRPNDSSAT
jgi:4-amino-4-deoxy-L-arabinose transferase-like glycosyltransferase